MPSASQEIDDEQWNSCETKEGNSLRDEIAALEDDALAADGDASDGEYPSRAARHQPARGARRRLLDARRGAASYRHTRWTSGHTY